MNLPLSAGLAVGALAVGGGAAYLLLSRHPAPAGTRLTTGDPAQPGASLPGVSTNPPVASSTGAAAPVTTADLAAQITATQAQEDAQRRADTISRLRGTASSAENYELQELASIQGILNDTSRLYDFTQQAYSELRNGPIYAKEVAAIKAAVDASCGPLDIFGACRGANEPKAEDETVDWSAPAIFLRLAQADAAPEATPNGQSLAGWTTGPQRLRAWQDSAAKDHQQRILTLETQYQGAVAELRDTYGVNYEANPNHTLAVIKAKNARA